MTQYVLCVLIGLLISARPVYAQNQQVIDSLRAMIDLTDGIEKYNVWHKLVVEYIDHDNQKALALMAEAEAAADASFDSMCILKSKRLRGQILYRLGKPQAVIRLLQPLALNDHLQEVGEEYLNVTNLLAVCHIVMSEFDQALEYLFLSFERARRDNNEYYMALASSNIGVVYYKLKDYAKALPFMIAGYQKQDSLGILKFGTAVNLSLCYSNLEQYDHALEFLEKGIDLCGNECSSLGLTHIKYASGFLFYGLKQYEKAEAEFLISLESSRRVNDHRMELDNIYLLAKISMERNDLRQAEHYLNAGDDLVRKKIPFNMEAIKVYSELSQLYLRLRKFERASFYQSCYIALRDSFYNEALMTNLMKIESGYLQRENEAKIATQANIIILRDEIIRHQNIVSWLVVGLAVTVSLLLIFLYEAFTNKKKLNRILEEKIRLRTIELDSVVRKLSLIITQRDLEIQKKSRILGEIAGSVERICAIGSVEAKDEVARAYLLRIQKSVHRSS